MGLMKGLTNNPRLLNGFLGLLIEMGSLILFITSGFGLLTFSKSRNPGSGFSKNSE
jgi:hypothetical protein